MGRTCGSAAKTHLSRLVRRAQSGEEIVIARGGKPVARLLPIESGAGRAGVRAPVRRLADPVERGVGSGGEPRARRLGGGTSVSPPRSVRPPLGCAGARQRRAAPQLGPAVRPLRRGAHRGVVATRDLAYPPAFIATCTVPGA